ncbi:conserved hypothetical protein [Trichinella spiralis]|uniref:hypothetical protein n=1 Tax=Trichinella spiralis TaxID=6334 RepID=UPI0001EFD974|nr:conserved hypothetical protein [Trichinella spiralis]
MPVTNTTLNYQKLSSHEWQLSCLSPSSKRRLKTKKQTEQLFEVNESDQRYLVTNNQSLLDRHRFEHQLCNIPCSPQPSSLLAQNIKQRFMKNKISSALRLKAQKTARMDETSVDQLVNTSKLSCKKNCAANVDSPLHMIEFVYKKGSTIEAVLSVPMPSSLKYADTLAQIFQGMLLGESFRQIKFGMQKLTNSCYASSEKQASSFVGFKWSNTVARGEVVSLTLGITGKELQFLARMSGSH